MFVNHIFVKKNLKNILFSKKKKYNFFFLTSTFLSEISETFKKLLEISRLGNE